MDFKDQFKLFKDEEQKLLKLKKELKKDALTHIKELIEQFNFMPADLFGEKKQKPPKVEFKGFEVGKVYKDGNNVYTYKKQGRKPAWLVFLVKNGATAQDLLKVDAVASGKGSPVVPGKAPQPAKTAQTGKKA